MERWKDTLALHRPFACWRRQGSRGQNGFSRGKQSLCLLFSPPASFHAFKKPFSRLNPHQTTSSLHPHIYFKMPHPNKVAKSQIIESYEADLVLSSSDLSVLSDVNKNVLLTNYLTLKGTAFSNIDRECWKYLVSYNMQFFSNWDLQEVSDVKLSEISYVNESLIKCESDNFVCFLPSLDKSEISPITMLACFLWDRINVYDDHNRDLPVVYNTDQKSSSELKYRIATKADLKSNIEFVNDVPLFRGKSVLQTISMNTVTKQYSKANQLINKNYKKHEFFTKLENDLYSQKSLVHREIDKDKIIQYLNQGKNINKSLSLFNKSSLSVYPILKELSDDALEETIVSIYNKAQNETYDETALKAQDEDIVKFQIYKSVFDHFKLIFPNDAKLVSLLTKHLLIGVPIIYSRLPHGLIRTSFNHLKVLPGFNVYWEKMLMGKNQTMHQNLKTNLNSGESLKIESENNDSGVSLDVIRLHIYKEIYENCKNFTDFREYLLKVLLKNGIETSKSKTILNRKRKNDDNQAHSLKPENVQDLEPEAHDVLLEEDKEPVGKKFKKAAVVKLPARKNETDAIIYNSLLEKETSNNNTSMITDVPALKQQAVRSDDKPPSSNPEAKEVPEIDPALVGLDGIPVPDSLNPLTDIKALVLDWFSPTTIQIAKLDKIYKDEWRNKEPIKSQYDFQKNFSSTFKKLAKKIIKEGSIKDLNMASATCVERLQEYVDSEFKGDLKEFLKFLNTYKNDTGKVWQGQ